MSSKRILELQIIPAEDSACHDMLSKFAPCGRSGESAVYIGAHVMQICYSDQ